MLPSVPESVDALRAALHKKGAEGHVQDAFNNLASCLILLNSSSPSVQMVQKLCTVLRQPPLPFYNACLQPALGLSSSVLSTVLERLSHAHSVGDESLCAAWDATAEVILSGILDFLDQKELANVELDGAVWEVLYRVICEFFFLDSGGGLPVFSIPLCLSDCSQAYNTLTETAARQITIRNALRQKDVLGGERLGAAISGTRDYLLLEALLVLFARLLPPTHNSSQGKLRRAKFVKEVLGSRKLFKCSTELLDIVQRTSGTHWDDVAAQIIDALARADITYPQPFSIDEIDVCGRVFPQPLATDRLILDNKAFLANIVVENDDICESLQVPYSRIRIITLDNSEKNVPKGKMLIMVNLTCPPLVASVETKCPDTSRLYAQFLLQNDAVARFMEALRRRGVGKLSFLNPLTRVERTRKSVSIGSGFKFTNDSSPIPPTASLEGKLQHVNQVYKTDIEDLTMLMAIPVSHADNANSLSMPTSGPPFGVVKVLESAVAEDNAATSISDRLTPSASDMSKLVQGFAPPFNPTGTVQLFGDSYELSEISDFESDNNAADERKATGISTSCNHEARPRRREIDRMETSEVPSAACASRKSPESASNITNNTERIVGSPQRGKPLLTSDSPILGSSSSTQIDASPRPLSKVNTLLLPAAIEDVDSLCVVSKGYFVGAVKENETNVNDCGSPEPIVASAGKPQIGFGPTEHELGQQGGSFTVPFGATKKGHSRVGVKKDTNVLLPPEVTGSRRKRESATPSSKPIIDDGDEPMPPCKKARDDTGEDKVKSNEISTDATLLSRVRGSSKTVKRSFSGNGLTAGEFVELPEFKPTCQGTRRSSRIKKRQTTTTGGIRTNTMRGKAQKRNVVGHKKLTITLKDTDVRISQSKPSIPGPRPVTPVTMEPAFPKLDNQPDSTLPQSSSKIVTLYQEFKASGNLACESNQLGAEVLRGDRGLIKQATSDSTQHVQEQFYIKSEEMNDENLVSNSRAVQNEDYQVSNVVENPVFLKESEDTVKSIPRTETLTIDLTTDDTAREKSGSHEASKGLMCSGADIQANLRTPQQSDAVVTEGSILVSSPRCRRRSVTFASPIEHVLNQRVNSKTQAGSSSRQPSSPSEDNPLSPLKIPAGTMSIKREPFDRTTSRVTLQGSKLLQASLHDQTADEVEMQDIVEVLNEIQAVIIKGISDKFKTVKKDIRHGRDELIQQVLGELRGMVVENARYFNGLLRLEEDYYKNSKAIARCWEDLIDCNDAIALQFQNALKEHDQKVTARTFPKSFQPLQPVFARHRASA